jgi:hypothetical protein
MPVMGGGLQFYQGDDLVGLLGHVCDDPPGLGLIATVRNGQLP